MPTPQNKKQTAIIWIISLSISLLLAAVASVMKQPLDQAVNWRLVFNDVGTVLIALTPAVVTGLGLPRLGGEQRATLINEIGHEKSEKVLELAAVKSQVMPLSDTSIIDYGKLADEILKKREESVQQPIRRQNSPSFSGVSPASLYDRNPRADT